MDLWRGSSIGRPKSSGDILLLSQFYHIQQISLPMEKITFSEEHRLMFSSVFSITLQGHSEPSVIVLPLSSIIMLTID